MAHMGCRCGNDMCDGDGHIVYDVYSKKDLMDYINNGKQNCTIGDMFEENSSITENNAYFWLCDKCKSIHLWTQKPKYCYRIYEIKKNKEEIKDINIKNLDEYYVLNINDYSDKVDKILISDFIKTNPIRHYKYYATKDLLKIYIINTTNNYIDSEYELKNESFIDYKYKTDLLDDKLIYTIEKINDGDEYIIKNGERIKENSDDYPHREVHYMIKVTDSDGNSMAYENENIATEIYTQNNMNEFYKKYGESYEFSSIIEQKGKDKSGSIKLTDDIKDQLLKYIYVEYEDMPFERLYCYTSINDYKIGDLVLVPRGWNDEQTVAKIINIKYYSYENAPYPFDKLKDIIGYVSMD